MNFLAATLAAAITWSLIDLSGSRHFSGETSSQRQITVLVFMAPDCLVSERTRPSLEVLHATYHLRRVTFYAVIAGRWRRESLSRLSLPFPILLDQELKLALQTQARVTPEAFVLDQKGDVAYRGSPNGLADAIEDVLAGRAVRRPSLRAVGCAISGLDVRASVNAPNFGAIAPILAKHCVECHRGGGAAPFSLETYVEAAPRSAAIAEAVSARRMPPWKPDPGPPHFVGERRLSSSEISTLVNWARAGSPRGGSSHDVGQRGDPPAAIPGHVVSMSAAYPVPADGPDIYRCFVLPANLDRDRWVRGFEFHPGDARSVHHALIFLDRSGAARRRDAETPEPGYPCFGVPGFLPSASLGGWAPGTGRVNYPDGSAVRLTKASDLVFQLHYAPTGELREDRSSVAIYFTDTPPTRRMMDIALGSRAIDIPAGEGAYRVTDHFTTPVDVLATGIIPHAHFIAKTMRGWATLPDGRRVKLLTIRDWDFNWQQQYRYREPILLPAGTRLDMEFIYDNSAANPRNPSSPPRRVTWGPESTDEMAGLHVQVSPVRNEDAEELGRSLWGKLMREIQQGRMR